MFSSYDNTQVIGIYRYDFAREGYWLLISSHSYSELVSDMSLAEVTYDYPTLLLLDSYLPVDEAFNSSDSSLNHPTGIESFNQFYDIPYIESSRYLFTLHNGELKKYIHEVGEVSPLILYGSKTYGPIEMTQSLFLGSS